MPTANEEILDRYIRHQTYILRYAGGLRNQITELFDGQEPRIFELILGAAANAEGNRTLTGRSGRKVVVDLSDALHELRDPIWHEVTREIQFQLRELVISEAVIGAAIIEGALPVVIGLTLPPAEKLISIVNSQPFQGRTLKEWLKVTAEADVQRMLRRAKIGIIQGETPTQVARAVAGTQAQKYKDGQSKKAFRDIESTLITLTNGIQQEAKQALYSENADLIKRELFVATLDSRTTFICQGNDGKTFSRGEGPIPPLHFRCRSLRVPYINPEALRNRGFDSATKKQLLREFSEQEGIPVVIGRDSLPAGFKTKFDKFARKRRRELQGQVPARLNYNDWLKTQTKEFQNEVLGPSRAEIFRKGDITLDQFTARDGDKFTLEDLKDKGIAA